MATNVYKHFVLSYPIEDSVKSKKLGSSHSRTCNFFIGGGILKRNSFFKMELF